MRKKSKRRFTVGYISQDRNVNVIVRSQLITAYLVLFIYMLLMYSEKYIVLPDFLYEIKFVLGGLIIAWVLWHTVNYLVSKKIIRSNK